MEIREADVEEDIWRVRVECRRLKEVEKIQFHLREMNLKSYIAEQLASHTAPATKEVAVTYPRKDIGRAVGYVSLKPTVVAAALSGSAKGVVHPFPRRAERQRHERHLFLIRGRYKGGCVLLCNKVRHTHFSSF